MKRNLLFLLFALCFVRLYAANKTWTGSGVWSNASAWIPAGVPGINDSVLFTGTGTCNLDLDVQVAHFEFLPTFSGTFNQNSFKLSVFNSNNTPLLMRGMKLDGTGTFNGGNNNINIGNPVLGIMAPYPLSHFTLTGAVTFTSTSDTLLVHGNFTNTSTAANAFSHNNGWVIIRGRGSAPGINVTVQNMTFSSLEFNSVDNGDPQFYLSLNMNITVEDTLLKSGIRTSLFNGIINVKGDLLITNVLPNAAGVPWGTSRINMNGTGQQRIVGKQATHSLNFLENVYIDKPSGTLHLVNYITVGKDWVYVRGAIDAGTSTVLFWGPGSISGNHALHNVRFTQNSNLQNRTILANDTLTVTNNLIFDGNNYADVYSGTIHAQGNVLVEDSNITGSIAYRHCGGDIRIVINGTGTQLLHGQTRRNTGYLPNIVIDKPSGILFMKDTINVEKSWTYIRGMVDAITQNSYVNFVGNRSDNNIADVPQNIDGEGASATMLFKNVGIDNPFYTLQIKRILTGDLRVQNTLNIRGHQLELNGNDLFLENSSSINALRRTTGMIISETTPPPGPGISRVHWSINNAPNGTAYEFPFATSAGDFIPFYYTVTTQGVPIGTGSISVATYPTDPNVVPTNRPLPPGVTTLDNLMGYDNSAKELDRYWVYDCYNYSTTPSASIRMFYLDSEWGGLGNNIDESLLRAHQWNPNTSVWNQPTVGATPVNTAANLAFVSNVTTCSAFTLVDPTLPGAVFYASDTMVCVGEPVTFTEAFTTPPVSRQWLFPGGTPGSSTAANPVVTYNVPGIYDVLLSSTYSGGTIRDTLIDYITVSPGLTITTLVTAADCQDDAPGSANAIATGGITPYSYLWSNGNTTQSIADTPGVYSVTITDAGGCVASDTVTIAQPAAMQLSASVTQQPASCNACDGRATVIVNGVNSPGPHTYAWSSGHTTASASGLCAGLYIVSVSDTTGCTDTVHVRIVNPVNLALTVHKTNTLCNGFANGAAGVDVANGTPPYTFAWSRGTAAGQDSVIGLSAGLVSVTVTDSAGCLGVDSVTIQENTQITFGLPTVNHVLCYGDTSGRVQFFVQGGSPPYTYAWSAGTAGTPGTIVGLPAGTVYITATDGNMCTGVDSVTVNQPDSLNITGIATDGFCGTAVGMIDITVTGGTPLSAGVIHYIYTWSNGSVTEDITNLQGGTYTVTVQDDNNCSATASFTVLQPGGFSVTMQTTNTPSCDSCNGTATVILNGTPLPLDYQWSTGQTTQTITGLCAGVYYVTVVDFLEWCADTVMAVINANTSAISLSVNSVGPTCANPADSVMLFISGATPPHFIDWGDGMQTPTYDTSELHIYTNPGIYLITVTDSVSCVQSIYDTVEDLSISVTQVEMVQPACSASNGKIQVAGNDGVAPYTYAWNTGATVDSIQGVAAGTYTVTVTDFAGCSGTDTFVLAQNNLNITVSTSVTRPTCTATNGKVVAIASNGTPPYSFNWSTGATVDSIINLAAGTYTVTVSDSAGCTASRTAVLVPDQQGLTVSLISTVQGNCTPGVAGSATILATGGTPPYIYLWNNAQTGPTVTGSTGSYNYTVTDANGCLQTGSVIIPYSSANFYVYIAAVQPNCATPGSLTAVVNGGTPPLTYLWNTTPPQTTQTATGLGTGTYTVTVTSGIGCARTGTYNLTSQCSNVINGTIFLDGNGNCVRDSGETVASGVTVLAQDGPRTFYGTADAAGNYSVRINMSGNFSLHAVINGNPGCNSLTLCGIPSVVSFPGVGDTTIINFGVSSPHAYDLTIQPGWSIANPGFLKTYWINYYNQSSGPYAGSATVSFQYDTNLVYQSSVLPLPVHDAVNRTLTWTVNYVPPGVNPNFQLRSTFRLRATTPIGYQLQSDFHIGPTSGDCDTTDNYKHFSETVSGAIDPNAKEVEPAGGITESDSVLLYTIHFQNTGTDTTHFVILRDTLSPHLNAGTAKTIAASHPYSEFTVSGEGILTWIFNPLYLPDSATDEAGSQGFVKFVVRKKPNLPIGTEIHNKVSIYFDYNAPIVTNTVKNTVVDPNWVFEPAGNDVEVRAVPNPFSEFTLITVKELNERFDFALFDLMGKRAEYIAGIQTNTFEVRRNDLPPGVYFYRIASAGKIVANGKVVVAGF